MLCPFSRMRARALSLSVVDLSCACTEQRLSRKLVKRSGRLGHASWQVPSRHAMCLRNCVRLSLVLWPGLLTSLRLSRSLCLLLALSLTGSPITFSLSPVLSLFLSLSLSLSLARARSLSLSLSGSVSVSLSLSLSLTLSRACALLFSASCFFSHSFSLPRTHVNTQ